MCKTIFVGTVLGVAICLSAAAFSQELAQSGARAGAGGPVPAPPGAGGGGTVFLEAPGQPAYGPGLAPVYMPGGRRDSREAELNAKVQDALNKYTVAKDDDGRQAAKKQLQAALTDLFDVKQKEREEEIKQIEERVVKLRETLRKRDSMKQELIEHHLTTLIQDAEGLGWGSDGGPFRASVRATPDGNAFYRIERGRDPSVPVLPSVQPRRE
jgi:hypothetical protein